MDKTIFLNSSAADNAMRQLEILSNNLANSGTVGFRGDQPVFKTVAVNDDPNQSKFYASLDRVYSSFEQGPVMQTGRDLDVAVSGQGFIAVQSKAGNEAYTRAGDLQVSNGYLVTHSGEFVKGNAGLISIPPEAQHVAITNDGTVSAKLAGQADMVTLDRIKLANPAVNKLGKGKDGLFHLANGETASRDENVKLIPGSLEGSNVNVVHALTDLIDLSRRFEFHTNLMKTYADNSSKLNQLLNIS